VTGGVEWLFLWLIPGLIGVSGAGLWLYQRGLRSKRLGWSLAGLAGAWTVGMTTIAIGWWPIGLIVISAAFAASIALLAYIVWRESTQQPEIARLRRIAEVRADRMAALSHEVRTPLALIKGATDLLLEGNPGPLTAQQQTFLKTVSQNCEHIIALAEDMLTQARIDAGLFKLRLVPVDLKALAWEAVRAIRLLTASREQIIHLNCPQVMDQVQADPRLLQQALTNLLQNASRYTSQGGYIYVTISSNDVATIVSVTDNGAGMSEEARRNLFQKFASGRPVGDGTGLGLVITKQIIEMHGGQIMVDTSLGRGTTFLFTLPHWRGNDANGQAARAGG
jgi:signal transduction histidine kinase